MEIANERVIDEIIELMQTIRANNNINTDNLDEPITGSTIMFNAENMTYLFFEVEKKYGISFTEDDLLNYGFSTINKVADLVISKL